MKLEFHAAKSRGHVNLGWLDSRHTFSFGEYYNPQMMGFGKLRVINDDIVEPGKGFATHHHENMEIISIPLRGSLEHKDTLGNGSIICDDEVQLMSAGKGVSHSEFNPSSTEQVNFLQIWILPNKDALKPSYQQQKFIADERIDNFQCLVSPDGRSDSLFIHQQVYLSRITIQDKQNQQYNPYIKNSGLYLFVINGEVNVADYYLNARDALAISDNTNLIFKAKATSELLLIETV